ncbi:right-handed parallel beta-helix repeat-containing protein, partial [bacterium]|nr:right-handed parallel beta-helix repeat-containing protein [bacterium]
PGMRADGVDGVVVRDSSFEGPSTDGLLLAGAVGAVVDGVLVEDAGGSGIALERASGVYLRNNRVARVGDWGISIDDATLPAPSVRDGNVVAFNTVWQAARFSSTSGGIRFVAASGEIRDNVVVAVGGSIVKTDLAPTVVHHNVLFGGARTFDSKSGEEPVRRANRVADPLLVDPAASDFSLRQVAAGQGADSPARDAGSGRVAVLDIGGSTRTDAVSDEGLADAGWHAGADAAGTRPAIAFVAPPGLGNTLHADAVAGDDERGYDQAQEGATPVRSARRAMALAQPGDVVVLEPGTYAESIEVPADGVVLRGSGARGAVIVQPPDGETGIEVAGHDDVTIENLVVEGGSRGLLATDSDRLRLFRVGSVVPEFVGLEVRDGTDAIVDSCFATGAGSHGVQLRRASGYLRNNLVYANGEWGLSVDASGLPSPLAGVVVAFNTVHANQDGIRMVNAGGEVRDNLLTEQVDLGLYLAGPNLLVHHNDFSANGRDRDQESAFVDTIRVWASIDGNPRYRDPSGPDDVLGLEGWADDDFRLRQLPGETPASPMVDAGSGPVGALDVGGSTRSDGLPDSGTADLGVHVDAPPATVPPPFATPPGVVASTYYVSSATGFDGRSSATARRRETPWATIGRALQAVEPGDSIVVLPGRYPATVQVGVPEVSIVSETRHAAVVAPVSGNGVSIEADDVTVSGFVVEDAQNNGVSVLDGADRAEVRDCALVRSRANGLLAKGVSGLVVEDVISVSSGQSGIVLRNTTGSTLRDVLSYENGEWGANVNSVVAGVVSGGHLVERGTFAFNALGGVRFAKAAGTIRDNLLTDTPGVGLRIDTAGSTLLHNGFFADAQEMDPATYILAQCSGCAANLVLDPVFVDPDGADGVRGGLGWADDDFRLSQVAAGQATQSEAVDAGSVGVDSLGPVGTTRTDGAPDLGTLDLGVHR